MRLTLTRSEILRGRNSFREAFNLGRKIDSKFLRCYVFGKPAESAGTASRMIVGFVVSRSLKRAVDRNHLKRLMRESYRRNKETLLRKTEDFRINLELVFVYSPDKSTKTRLPSFSDIENDIRTILRAIAKIQFRPVRC